jgi:hypothetical protein
MGKITIGMVAIVMGNVRNDVSVALELTTELEKIIDSAYFTEAPFNNVDIIIEYGDKENCLARIGRLYKKERLPVIAQLKMSELIKLSKEELYQKFKLTLLNTLLEIGKKYNLPADSIKRELRSLFKND